MKKLLLTDRTMFNGPIFSVSETIKTGTSGYFSVMLISTYKQNRSDYLPDL